MRILLTGAGGFVGRRLVPMLLAQGHRPHCVLRQATAMPDGATPVVANLAASGLATFDAPVDAVIHLAQSSRYRDFPGAVDDIFAVNVGSTARLLDLARRLGAKSFVLASTGSVYAGTDGPCREDAALHPGDFYAASKLAAELLLKPYHAHFPACALRLFTPYGPNQQNRLVPTLIDRVRRKAPVSLDGEADGLRLAAAYVDDVADTIIAAAEGGWDGVYNVAAPQPVSIGEIARTIGDVLGITPVFERTGRPEPAPLIPDLTRLAGKRSLQTFRGLESGLRSTIGG